MKTKLVLSGLVIAMSLCGASAFAASTIQGTGTFKVGNDYAGGVNIKLDGTTLNGEGGGNIAHSQLNGKALDFSYCIDILHSIYLNGTYNAFYNNTAVLTDRPEIAANGGKIAWLLTNEAQSASTKAQQAGLQAAIWKQTYGDRFELLATSATAIKTAYNNYITALGSHTASVNTVLWIDPRNGNGSHAQDQVAWGSGFQLPTPIPAAIWLFGSGLVGLLGFRRKSNQVLPA
jgi:hypothetical protein